MDERHSRIQQYPWLSPVLLAGAVGLELLTPAIINGAALVAVAGMVAAITTTFRDTLLVVTVGVAIIFVAALFSEFTDFEKGVQIAEVVIAGALALAVRRMLDRQSASFSVVRSTVETLQRAVLPPLPTIVGPMTVACRYEAASTEARIGGDLYAVEETPFGLRLLIADVRGRGLGAVSAVSVIVGAFRERARSEPDLVGLAERLDLAVARSREQYAGSFAAEAAEAFATALLVEIDPRGTTLRLLSCGHPAPYLLRDGEMCQLDTGEATPPLGMRDLAPGTGGPQSCDFPAGTTLLCVTDGVTEARNTAGTFYDPCRDLRPVPDGDPERLIGALFSSVGRWTKGERDDDMAVVAVARVGGRA
ncbi:PP2C family protein-serine/threonine phosphatase [Streptomyces sp. IB2014 016-6]|uniref:PP2C family protein-serine/threonine phosphatase n=1 Tax=Streptomyces sp. IB2014 016-6 TaxID=2517818 RepID=UPI0011CB13D4|nr:PP2C family protein-serine/threonine phosphatase [Streptomyces sp. IB2014 016-6]TXL88078.1 serine/threonine-protein phosphatase [Streptomyces sp. IB2014 016-6]